MHQSITENNFNQVSAKQVYPTKDFLTQNSQLSLKHKNARTIKVLESNWAIAGKKQSDHLRRPQSKDLVAVLSASKNIAESKGSSNLDSPKRSAILPLISGEAQPMTSTKFRYTSTGRANERRGRDGGSTDRTI